MRKDEMKSFKDVYRQTDEEWEAERRYFAASEKLGRTLLRCLSVVVGPDEKRAEEMIQAIAHMDDPKEEGEP